MSEHWPIDMEKPMDQLLREQMRVFSEAELVLAERMDPDDWRPSAEIAAENKDKLIVLYQQMCDEDVTVQSILRKQRYEKLHALLLDAARECQERGFDKGVIDRFTGAAAVCDRAAGQPRD